MPLLSKTDILKKYDLIKLTPLLDKSIIITGAGGMLGSAFTEFLMEAASRHKSDVRKILAFTRDMLDVVNRDNVLSLASRKPGIIIHCAAKVDAEYCEGAPEHCREIIVNGTKNIVDAAHLNAARVLYPQSFLIFDGFHLPISEETPPRPLSVYGENKLEAEKLVLSLPGSLSIRMAGFFGGYEKDKNFVGKFAVHLSKIIKAGQAEIEVGDRIWQPTFTYDLAYNSLVLLSHNKTGIYNMASHGQASFHDIACEMIAFFNLSDRIKAVKVPAEQMNLREKARRPPKAIIINKRLKDEGLDFQRDWKDGLREYLNSEYFWSLYR